MRCNKAREFVSQELDAILPPDATGRLRDHLDACADCREYREDLLVGQRLFAATEPTLSENFEWKLQLRLNRALQEAAGEVRYPWQDPEPDRWHWWRNFGASTAVGLAAVLALAMVFGPVERVRPSATRTAGPAIATSNTDRLPLFQPGNGGLYQPAARPVSLNQRPSTGTRFVETGWTGTATEDLKTIRRLRDENRRLSNLLIQYQRQNERLRAQLDTSGTRALDLGQEQ